MTLDIVTHPDIARALAWHMRDHQCGAALNDATNGLAELMGMLTYLRLESTPWISLSDEQQRAIAQAAQHDASRQPSMLLVAPEERTTSTTFSSEAA